MALRNYGSFHTLGSKLCLCHPPFHAESTLSVPNISRELVSVSDWYLLGIKLGLQPHDLRKIQQSHPSANCERWKVEVIDLWLRNSLGSSWKDVVDAVNQMGEHAVARKIQLKYIRVSQGMNLYKPVAVIYFDLYL